MRYLVACLCYIFTITVYAHGYIQNSRSKMCAEGGNQGCGAIRYEPQSVEGPDRFPETGPADGTIAAAGSNNWAPLNEQTPTRWRKFNMQSGTNTFNWHFTATHSTRDWRYFITKQNWNPSQPLTRNSFDLTPFCTYQGNFQRPPVNLSHECNVPQRSGYQVILSVWDVGDTALSFYQVLDVQFPDGPTNTTYTDVGDIFPSTSLSQNDLVRIRPFSNNGELSGQRIEYVIASDTEGEANVWPQRVAEHINNQSSQLKAGVLNNQGDIIPAFGKNDIFAASDSSIIRAEVEIVQNDVVPQPEISVSLSQNQFPNDQALNLSFDVTTNQVLQVTAQLYFGNIAVGYQREVVTTSRNFNLFLSDPQVGDYDLIVTAENTNTQEMTQKTLGISVYEPDPTNPDLPVYPSGRGSYNSGDLVIGRDGNTYQCLIGGWCNSSSEFYYAPGTGLAWTSAWKRVVQGPPPSTDADYIYPDGRGQYRGDTIVGDRLGNTYKCKVSGWCNHASATYFAPGTGLAWRYAWTQLP